MIRKIKYFLQALLEVALEGFKSLISNKPKFYHHIILINILTYFATHFFLSMGTVKHLIGYSFYSDNFEIWQPITSMFMHGGFWHLFINMLVFWSMAGMFEKMMSKIQFATLYFTAGLVGYCLQSVFSDPNIPMVGASGAVFGFLASAIILTPNKKFYIIFFPFIGFKAKWLISIGLLTELVLGIVSAKTGIGHMCHFGGGITGILISGFWVTKKIPNYIKSFIK